MTSLCSVLLLLHQVKMPFSVVARLVVWCAHHTNYPFFFLFFKFINICSVSSTSGVLIFCFQIQTCSPLLLLPFSALEGAKGRILYFSWESEWWWREVQVVPSETLLYTYAQHTNAVRPALPFLSRLLTRSSLFLFLFPLSSYFSYLDGAVLSSTTLPTACVSSRACVWSILSPLHRIFPILIVSPS